MTNHTPTDRAGVFRTVEQSVPKLHRDHVPATLDKLIEDHIIIIDGTGKCLLNPTRKDIAA